VEYPAGPLIITKTNNTAPSIVVCLVSCADYTFSAIQIEDITYGGCQMDLIGTFGSGFPRSVYILKDPPPGIQDTVITFPPEETGYVYPMIALFSFNGELNGVVPTYIDNSGDDPVVSITRASSSAIIGLGYTEAFAEYVVPIFDGVGAEMGIIENHWFLGLQLPADGTGSFTWNYGWEGEMGYELLPMPMEVVALEITNNRGRFSTSFVGG
jgi:hypothetical protein